MRPKDKNSAKTLTPVVFHSLLALSQGPQHGYAISQEVESASGGRVRMGPGTLYGSLQRMQRAGLVQECELAEARGPHVERRRYYEMTPTGKEALRSEARRIEQLVGLEQFRAVVERR